MKIGIIGTGRIAKRFVSELSCVDGTEITAVYNPHPGSAEKFVEGFGSKAIATDDINIFFDHIDAVYIASPHETHYIYIVISLEKMKHVLCEKPITLSLKEAEKCFKLAEDKSLVLMEGLKTAHCPGYKKLIETVKCGVIGDIKFVESSFTKLEDSDKRELKDNKYGGSFTELGSYVLLPIFDLFGRGYVKKNFFQIDNDIGIDIFTKTDLVYKDSFATAICGLGVKKEGSLIISGTKGYIKADAPWWKTKHFEVHFEDPFKVITYDEAFEGDGLRYEIIEFMERIRKEDTDTLNMEKERALFLSGMMEAFLKIRNGDK